MVYLFSDTYSLLIVHPTVGVTYTSKTKAPAKTAPRKAVFLRKRRLGCRLAIGARVRSGPEDGAGAGAGPMGVGSGVVGLRSALRGYLLVESGLD